MTRLIVGPFNRVEGDLEVKLEIAAGHVTEAHVNSTLFRGFEVILQGKDPLDALVFTPRICGICSVAQSMAAAYALAEVQQLDMPLNGELATNLILATENMADHLTHFYLFFMPDFARDVYRDEAWHQPVASRFKAVTGSAASEMLAARAEFMHLMGILAGKWPHSLSLQPGGSTRAITSSEKVRMLGIVQGFRRFLERVTFGDELERVVSLDSLESLQSWADEQHWQSSDLRCFLHLSEQLQLDTLGRSVGRFMSYGNYPMNGQRLFKPGVWDRMDQELNMALVTEDLSHAWMCGADEPRNPFVGVTKVDAEQPSAYSWCKAPRLNGEVMEVGALARQQIDHHPLIMALVEDSGGNVRNRVIARLLELARVVIEMEHWVRQLSPSELFCHHAEMPAEAEGLGLVEAARGSLGHWIKVEQGRISNYQIIAPTTWNFSPRDQAGQPGILEQALVGAPVRAGEKEPVAVQHIVRSFDPCMVCTVH